MNIGYAKSDELDLNCPLCGHDIYVNKKYDSFNCTNKNCDIHESKGMALSILFNIIGNETDEKLGEVKFIVSDNQVEYVIEGGNNDKIRMDD